jgi:hypothetical protein
MATRTCVNGQTVVHKTSEGTVFTTPDVCMTPMGTCLAPIPYTNRALSEETSNGSKSVLVDGNSIMLKDSYFTKSTGDEPGIAKGISSGTTGGEATFTNYSFDVKIEGRNVCRRLDPMTSNNGNTPPSPLMQTNVNAEALGELGDKHPLPITFVHLHPDVVTGRTTQPVFQTLHEVRGPETHRQKSPGYTGALHQCDQPDGEYVVVFDDFNLAEETFEYG